MRLLAFLLTLPLVGQSLILTADDEVYLKAEVASNSARWQALKAVCDSMYTKPVRNLAPNMLDTNYSEINSNGPFTYGITPIQGSYEAGDLLTGVIRLGACYKFTVGNPGFADQARSAAYGAKAKDILMTVARPTAWMTRSLGVANIVVNNGTATVTGLAHGQIGNADNYFLAQITGTGSPILDGRQRAVGITATSWSFPTTAPSGTYTPTNISFLISTDGESGTGGIGHRFTIEQVAKGATTTINVSTGSAFRVGQRVRIWGLPAPYDALNGTWTAGAGTTSRAIKVPVDTSSLATTTTTMIGSYAAATEEANAVSAVSVGATTTLTTAGSFMVGDNVRVWGLPAPYDVINGTYTAAAGTSGATLVIPYNSTALVSGSIPASTAYAGDLTRLRLSAQTLSGIHVGDTFTVTGVRGCTVANGTWKIAANTKPLRITYPDGSPAPALAGECSYDAPRQSNDAGYHLRNLLPLLAFGYSWLGPLLGPEEKQAVVDKLEETAWIIADNTIYPNLVHPMNNYYTSTVAGMVMADVALGAAMPAWVHDWCENRVQFMTGYLARWIAHGGYPQGLRDYGFAELGRVYRAATAKVKAGVDWRLPPYSCTWLAATLDYLTASITPDGAQVEDWGIVANLGGVTTSQDMRISADATLAMAAWANAAGDSRAARFSKFHHDALANVQAAAATIPPVYSADRQAGIRSNAEMDFLLERAWAEADWTPTDLTYYAFTGDYAISRTAWSDPNAVYLTLQGNAFLDTVGQGKQKMKLGEVTIRRGGMKRLVGTADGFVARIQDKPGVDDLHSMNAYSGSTVTRYNRYYNGFWASPGVYGGSQYYNNWCVAGTNPDIMDRTKIPSFNANVVSMPAGSQPQLTSKVDASGFSYWKAANIGCHYTLGYQYAGDAHNHVQSWTREVLFLRPAGIAVVRDVSTVRNGTEDRFMGWIVAKGGAVADVPGGKRFAVSNAQLGGDIGAITFLAPASLGITKADCVKSDQVTSFNACDRLEVRPAANDHATDTFVTVLDPSGDLTQLTSAAVAPATNGEAYEVGTTTVAAWAASLPFSYSLTDPGIHLHVIAGLPPGSTVYRTIAGNTFTFSTSGSTALTVPASGILSFSIGSDPAIPYITTASLPAVDQGSAYPTFAIAAANGTPPYTFSIISGALPAGLALGGGGAISGTPTAAGTFNVTFRVRDSFLAEGTAALALVVNPTIGNPTITTNVLPEGLQGTSYNYQMAAASGSEPYAWSLVEGAACASSLGISLSASGLLSGSALTAGTCDLLFAVVDAASRSGSRRLALTVNAQIQNTLRLETVPGVSTVLLKVGVAGLSAAAACTVTIRDAALNVVATAQSTSGLASRSLLLSGLSASTPYTVVGVCGSYVAPSPVAFTTRSAGSTSTLLVSNTLPSGASGMTVAYGSGFSSTATASCEGERCTATLAVPSHEIVQYRFTYTGLARTSRTLYALLP